MAFWCFQIQSNRNGINLDLVSEIVDGKVHFSINSEVADMVGSQFNIVYNTDVLTLENVIFDTGNEMTNIILLRKVKLE